MSCMVISRAQCTSFGGGGFANSEFGPHAGRAKEGCLDRTRTEVPVPESRLWSQLIAFRAYDLDRFSMIASVILNQYQQCWVALPSPLPPIAEHCHTPGTSVTQIATTASPPLPAREWPALGSFPAVASATAQPLAPYTSLAPQQVALMLNIELLQRLQLFKKRSVEGVISIR